MHSTIAITLTAMVLGYAVVSAVVKRWYVAPALIFLLVGMLLGPSGLGVLPAPERAPDLQWVQVHWAGVNRWLDHPLVKRVKLTNSSGVHAAAMGEHVLLMMLAMAHRLPLVLQRAR